MAEKYFAALGRRKRSIARVRITPGGTGKLTVNGKEFNAHFVTESQRQVIKAPLQTAGKLETVDISVRVLGGGLEGQAGAVQLGVARALVKMDETVKTSVKTEGFLTRDPRKKERKKFGKRGARRSKQWRKR